jgi:uncharacterized membrane protein YgdD (TMEM256/DUF423 family)
MVNVHYQVVQTAARFVSVLIAGATLFSGPLLALAVSTDTSLAAA